MTEAAKLKPNKESEITIMLWLKMIRENEKYYFSKAMELFAKLPARHQSGLIKHLAEATKHQYWIDNIDDTTQHREVMKSILFYYSGREVAGDPTKKKFAQELAAYVRSKDFKGAGHSADAKTFKDELGKI